MVMMVTLFLLVRWCCWWCCCSGGAGGAGGGDIAAIVAAVSGGQKHHVNVVLVTSDVTCVTVFVVVNVGEVMVEMTVSLLFSSLIWRERDGLPLKPDSSAVYNVKRTG